VGLPTEAVRNVGRGRISLDCDDPRLRGDRCRAHHWGSSIALDRSWSTKGRYCIRRSTSLNRMSKAGCIEGIVSKRLGSPTAPGKSRHRVKSKNPKHPAVKREAEEDRAR
jgi:hypothetical protein